MISCKQWDSNATSGEGTGGSKNEIYGQNKVSNMAVIGPHTRALSQMWTSCIINYFIFRPHQSQKSKQSRQVIYRGRFGDFLTITVCSAFTRSYILISLHIPLDLRDKHLIQTIANPTPKSPYAFIHSFVSHLT